MRNTFKSTTGGLALILGLGAGCGSANLPQVASDPKAVDVSIQKSLDHLRTLQIFDVGSLVLNLPAEATSCYGVPCAGSSWVGPYQEERARQAPRLAALADLAEQLSHNAYLPAHAASEATAAVQALASLEIVRVSALVQIQPVNNPDCYNLPCMADIQAADRQNAQMVTEAFGIADAARKAGL